jgi:hypothetical protein
MTLVLPVMLGDPPYNQSRTAVGYVTVHIKSADINGKNGQVEVFHATITKDVVKGTGGIPGVGLTKTTGPGMMNISAGTVKLVT